MVIAITNVLLPHFSRSILENRKKTFDSLFKTLKVVFGTVTVLVIVGVLVSPDLVAFLFERKEFDSEDTYIVARIQQIFLVYLPFTISGMIMVNFLTSINKNAIMAYISFIALILNIILDYIFMQYLRYSRNSPMYHGSCDAKKRSDVHLYPSIKQIRLTNSGENLVLSKSLLFLDYKILLIH